MFGRTGRRAVSADSAAKRTRAAESFEHANRLMGLSDDLNHYSIVTD